jgi:hypothetical protein
VDEPELELDLERHPIRDETGRQVVILIAGLLFVAAAAVIERWATSPDAWRSAKMRAARYGERACAQTAADMWHAAEACRRVYERAR